MVLEAHLVLCMRTMEVHLHCPWYFDFERSVDGLVYQSCPSSLSSTSGHLLPFLLTVEQTKKAGLETGVSSHLVLHNKSVGKCSRQSQCQWVVSMTREWWAQIDVQTLRQLACHFWIAFGWKRFSTTSVKVATSLRKLVALFFLTCLAFLVISFPFCAFLCFRMPLMPSTALRRPANDSNYSLVMYFNNSLTIWNTQMNAIDKGKKSLTDWWSAHVSHARRRTWHAKRQSPQEWCTEHVNQMKWTIKTAVKRDIFLFAFIGPLLAIIGHYWSLFSSYYRIVYAQMFCRTFTILSILKFAVGLSWHWCRFR